MCKIFADDTSLFSIENSTHSSQSVLNSDLKCINEWAYQWKMHFNPDPKKQANEVITVHIKNTWVLSLTLS